MNIVSPGVHDNVGALAEQHATSGQPVTLDGPAWGGGKCLKCTRPQPVGEETIKELRKAKYGEEEA